MEAFQGGFLYNHNDRKRGGPTSWLRGRFGDPTTQDPFAKPRKPKSPKIGIEEAFGVNVWVVKVWGRLGAVGVAPWRDSKKNGAIFFQKTHRNSMGKGGVKFTGRLFFFQEKSWLDRLFSVCIQELL